MKHASMIFGFAAAALISLPVMATPISTTIELGRVYTGGIPTGTAPWLEATFDGETDSNTGTLTLTSHLTGGDFVQGSASASAAIGWAFSIADLDAISCQLTSVNCPDHVFFGGSYNAGSVPGNFNLAFGWKSNDRFSTGDSAVFDMTFSDALSGSPFFANQSYTSVAHVQGIGGTNCSGWIVDGSGTGAGVPCGSVTVPEPAALGSFGLGVLLIGLFVGLRRRLD